MIEYVAGFLYDPLEKSVALVRKNKPDWQAGKLNGIGGKIESGETPHDAMVREFHEETGVLIDSWDLDTIIEGTEFKLYFFSSVDDSVFNVKTVEDEVIELHEISTIWNRQDLMRNLRTLLSISLDYSGILKPVLLKDHE